MYTPVDNQLGLQPVAFSSAVQNHPLGKTVRAYDPVYGEGEFIYLVGVANTVVGSVVTWGSSSGTIPNAIPSWQTVLAPSTANLGQPVAIAMSANVASQYGWYQIEGQAVVVENGTFTAGAAVFLGAAGGLTTTVAAGKQVLNARSVIADGQPSAGFGVVEIDRPTVQGQIT
jgi:hypothetical protein